MNRRRLSLLLGDPKAANGPRVSAAAAVYQILTGQPGLFCRWCVASFVAANVTVPRKQERWLLQVTCSRAFVCPLPCNLAPPRRPTHYPPMPPKSSIVKLLSQEAVNR